MTEEHHRKSVAEQALKKLDILIEQRKDPQFTEEEADKLREFANMLMAFEAMGSLGSMAARIIIWSGIMFGAYVAIRNGAIEFVQDVISGNKKP